MFAPATLARDARTRGAVQPTSPNWMNCRTMLPELPTARRHPLGRRVGARIAAAGCVLAEHGEAIMCRVDHARS